MFGRGRRKRIGRRAHDMGRAGMSIARAAAIGSLVVAIIAVGVLMFGGGGGTEYTVRMQTANQLVKGNQVRVGGLAVGEDHRHQAVGGQPGRHQGHDQRRLRSAAPRDRRSRCARSHCPRWRTATSRCTPGPTTAPEIPDGGTLDADETTNVVDLDQLFNTLDPKARKGLQGVLRGFGTLVRGPERQPSGHVQVPGALAREPLPGDGGAGARPEDLREPDRERRQGDRRDRRRGATTWPSWSRTGPASRGRSAPENDALDQALAALPDVLEEGSVTFRNLRAALVAPERAHRRLQAADQGPGAVPAAVRAPVRDDATDVRGPARAGQPARARATTRST